MLELSMQNKLNEIRKSILVLDIESSAFYPGSSVEVNIRTNFEDYIVYAQAKWFGAYSYKYDKYYILTVRDNIQQIQNLLKEHNIIVGFNVEEFDFPIIKNNGLTAEFVRYNIVDCMQILGTVNQRNKNGFAFKNRAALMDVKLKSNSLKSMALAFGLETQKGDIDYKIFQKDVWTEAEELEIRKYLNDDIMSTKQLFDRLWNYWLPFAELLDEKNVYDLSWIKNSIASLTYKAACRVLGVEPTYSDKVSHLSEMGGNVYEPKYEESFGVWYVDFGSLYPHIFTIFNLPSEVKFENIKEGQKIFHKNDLFETKGYYDITEPHPLSLYIAKKLEERIYLKDTDPKNPMVYTLKILLNGLYGIFRSPNFEQIHTPNCGWDCCWLGQQIQDILKETMEQFGFELIQGDTDSCFFRTDDPEKNTKEYVTKCLQQVIDIINDNVPYPSKTFKINIEHYIEYLMVPFSEETVKDEEGKSVKVDKKIVKERKGKKKNYLYTYKDKEGNLKVKLIGLPIIKDNATKLGIKIYNEVLEQEIIKNNKAKFSKEYINSILQDYLKRPEIMQLIAIEYKVNDSESYKSTSTIQAQISLGYLDGLSGRISLIKNNKIGNVGKGQKYCTIKEAIENKLTADDIDLDKVWEELSPFVQYVENTEVIEKKPRKKKEALTKT